MCVFCLFAGLLASWPRDLSDLLATFHNPVCQAADDAHQTCRSQVAVLSHTSLCRLYSYRDERYFFCRLTDHGIMFHVWESFWSAANPYSRLWLTMRPLGRFNAHYNRPMRACNVHDERTVERMQASTSIARMHLRVLP